MAYELSYLISEEIAHNDKYVKGNDAYADGVRAGLLYTAKMLYQECSNYEDVLDCIDVIDRMCRKAGKDADADGLRTYEREYTLGLSDAYKIAVKVAKSVIAENKDNLDDFVGE